MSVPATCSSSERRATRRRAVWVAALVGLSTLAENLLFLFAALVGLLTLLALLTTALVSVLSVLAYGVDGPAGGLHAAITRESLPPGCPPVYQCGAALDGALGAVRSAISRRCQLSLVRSGQVAAPGEAGLGVALFAAMSTVRVVA